MANVGLNANLQSELTANASVMQQAQQEVTELEKAPQQAEVQDNRERLNDFYQGQKTGRVRNTVQLPGGNWNVTAVQKPAGPSDGQQAFNNEWLGKNKLNVQDEGGKQAQTGGKIALGYQMTTTIDGSREGLQSGNFFAGKGGKSQGNAPNQPTANPVVQGKAKSDLAESARQQNADFEQERAGRDGKDSDAVNRYKQRLEQQVAQQPAGQQVLAPDSVLPAYRPAQRVPVPGDFASPQRPVPVQPPPTGQPQSGATVMPPLGLDPFSTAEEGKSGGEKAPAAKPMPPATPPPVPGRQLTPGMNPPGAFSADLDIPFSQAGVPAAATGLASLDFELPTCGVPYYFTTPRGEVEITARTVSKGLLQRLIEIAVVLVTVLVVWYASRLIGAGTFGWFAGRTGSTLLVCLGALSFCGGAWPILGLAALATGCGLKIHGRTKGKPAAGG